MLQRDDYAGQANEQQLSEANLQKCVASLKLVEPLMLASLIRPGLGEDVSGEEIVKAQSKLLFRTLDLADRILKNLNVEAPLTPTNRYLVAREIVGLVAMHWRHGSDLSAADMAALAEHAVAGGLQLMDALNAEPFTQGEDQSERLNNAVAATTGIMLAMREKASLGHQTVALCREMTNHLAKVVGEQAARLRVQNHTPAIKTLIRVCSDYYPILWDSEITAATKLFASLSSDPAKFRSEAERLRTWPLEAFFKRVEEAVNLCIGMAASMQQLLDSQSEIDSTLNP